MQGQWRNQKLGRQAKVKRIHHHQTSFTTNAEGTSLNGKEKATTWKKWIMNEKSCKGKCTVKVENHLHSNFEDSSNGGYWEYIWN